MIIRIRRGVVEDAAVLADLARTTFYDTFAATNDATDMALHLQRAYGVPQQTAEITDPRHHDAAGRAGPRGDCVCADSRRPYSGVRVWTGAHRVVAVLCRSPNGMAGALRAALMDRVKAEARARGAKTLWLGVWERNDRARAFYAKCGFADAGEHIFLFGTDPQTDRVMTLSL